MADVGTEKVIHGEDGEYLVRTNEDGYTITKLGEVDHPLNLVYDAEKRTWNVVAEGKTYELMTMNEDGTVTYKQQDGTSTTVMPEWLKETVAV